MRVRFIIIFLILLCVSGLEAKNSKSDNDVFTCKATALKLKNCHLKMNKTKIHVWQDKIFINDSIRRSQESILESGDAVEWISVQLKPYQGRLFLLISLWGLPKTDVHVTPRIWYVYELRGHEAKLIENKIVQRRRKTDKGYEFDKLIEHTLEKLIAPKSRRTTHAIPTH
jgi:hypothetical protein